jgi:hypothetical protein
MTIKTLAIALMFAALPVHAQDLGGYGNAIRTALRNVPSLKQNNEADKQSKEIIEFATSGSHGRFTAEVRLAIACGLVLNGCHYNGVSQLLSDIEDVIAANDLSMQPNQAKEFGVEIGRLIQDGTCSKQLLGYLDISAGDFEGLTSSPSADARLIWLHQHLASAPFHGLAKSVSGSK